MTFLTKMNEHFEPVPYAPVPDEGEASSGRGHATQETPPTGSESEKASPSSAGTILDSKEQFEWAFLDLDGAVWAMVKAKYAIFLRVCINYRLDLSFKSS